MELNTLLKAYEFWRYEKKSQQTLQHINDKEKTEIMKLNQTSQ